MRLIDIARDSIKVLQTVGDKGINNIELAKKLNIPRRRIYDIIAILKASNVIATKREKGGTRIYWIGNSNQGSDIAKSEDQKSTQKAKITDEVYKELNRLKELEKENLELKRKIDMLNNVISKIHTKKGDKPTNFPNKSIIIRSKSPSEKIKRVLSSKYQVFIEVDSPGLIVEPVG